MLQSSQFVAGMNESRGGVVKDVLATEEELKRLLCRGLEGRAQKECRLDCWIDGVPDMTEIDDWAGEGDEGDCG